MKNKNYVVTVFNCKYGTNEIMPGSYTRKDATAYAKQLRASGAENVRVINYIKHAIIDA